MEKLVSIDQIRPDINIDEVIPFVLENDVSVELRRCIPIHNVVTMVRDVINTLTDMNSMVYLDEMKSFIIRLHFLLYYINIDIPEDVEEQYRFVVSHAPMINQMIDSVGQNQWNDILSSIIAKELREEKNVKTNDLLRDSFTKNELEIVDEYETIVTGLLSLGFSELSIKEHLQGKFNKEQNIVKGV